MALQAHEQCTVVDLRPRFCRVSWHCPPTCEHSDHLAQSLSAAQREMARLYRAWLVYMWVACSRQTTGPTATAARRSSASRQTDAGSSPASSSAARAAPLRLPLGFPAHVSHCQHRTASLEAVMRRSGCLEPKASAVTGLSWPPSSSIVGWSRLAGSTHTATPPTTTLLLYYTRNFGKSVFFRYLYCTALRRSYRSSLYR